MSPHHSRRRGARRRYAPRAHAEASATRRACSGACENEPSTRRRALTCLSPGVNVALKRGCYSQSDVPRGWIADTRRRGGPRMAGQVAAVPEVRVADKQAASRPRSRWGSRRVREALLAYAYLTPAFLVLTVFSLGPFVYVFHASTLHTPGAPTQSFVGLRRHGHISCVVLFDLVLPSRYHEAESSVIGDRVLGRCWAVHRWTGPKAPRSGPALAGRDAPAAEAGRGSAARDTHDAHGACTGHERRSS
jgi:hypothetical protein